MKEYEGLKIPDISEEDLSLEEIQSSRCNTSADANRCDNVHCGECIYNEDNLKQFTEWYNENKKP